MVDDATVKAHICALRIKELTECLDRLGMKKSGRKDDLARRLLTVIDDANSLSATGASSRGMPQVEATRRVVEEVYARMVGERGGRSVHTLAYADAPSAPSGSTANGGVPTPNTANPLGASGATSQLRTHHAHPPQPPLSYQPPMRSSAPSSFTSSHAPGTSATAAAAAGGGRPFVPNALGFLPVQYSQLNSNSGGTSGSRAGTQQAPSTSGHTGVGSSFAAGVVRCICEHPVTRTTDMLQCSNCKVLQHARCVIKPDARSATHMCERCRAERIDPYWEVVSADVMPAFKLVPTGKSAYVGTKLEPLQSAERTFTITPQQYELFKKRPNHKLQVVCMQIGDPVPYRCIWPMASDLKVNGLQLQVYNRAAHSKVGRNQRDEPANIGVLCHPTRNRISMGCTDPSSYVLLLQIVKQRTMEDVKRLTKPPLPLSEAIERVKQEIKSSDEDIEVDQAVVSLKCPLSGMRMKTPARFSEIPGLMFFDLDTFLSVVQRSRKWQCPNSMRNSSVFTLQVDSFMASILSSLRNLPDVAEVQISPEGQWRPVGGPGAKGSGSTWPWIDAGVAADALPVPNAPPAGQPQIKPEVKEEPGGGGRPSTGGNSEEEDADAELKKAAQAMQAQQRQAQAMQSELIVLDDSSDDDAAPASKRPRPDPPAPPQPPAPHHPTPTHPTPQHPIRVRIRPPSSLPGQPPTHPSLQPPNPHPTHTLPTLDHNNPSTSSHPSHSPAPLSLPPGAPLGSSAPTPPTLTSSTFPANPTLAHSLQFPPPTPLPPNTVHQPPQGPIPPNNPHTAAAAAAAAAAVRTSAAMGGSSTLPQPPSNLTSMSSPLPAMGAADANSRPSAFQHLTSHNQLQQQQLLQLQSQQAQHQQAQHQQQLLQLQQQHQHHQHVQLLQQLQRARDQQHQNLHSSALSSPSDSLMSTHPSPHPPTFPHPPGAPPSRSLTPHLPPPSSQPQQQQHPTSLPFPHLPPGIPNPSASLPMPGLPLHSPLLGSMPGSTFPSRSPSAQPPTMPGGYFTGLDVKAPSSVPFAPPPPSASQQPPQQQAQQQNHDTEVIVIDSD